jgi:hypothetical protein
MLHRFLHALICAVTRSSYSHCELVIDGLCYTSSNRDGGVRAKRIDLTTGAWDVFPITGDREAALRWFREHYRECYDWIGALRIALPFLPNHARKWFCSEAVGAALGLPQPERITPQSLLDHFNLKGSTT